MLSVPEQEATKVVTEGPCSPNPALKGEPNAPRPVEFKDSGKKQSLRGPGLLGRDSSTGANVSHRFYCLVMSSPTAASQEGGLYMDTDGEELHRLRFVQLLYRRNKMDQITK